MYISEVIRRVDELYPNSYSTEQKLSWCYEVSMCIRRSIRKIYDVLTFEYAGSLSLPDGIEIEDVDTVFVNGKRATKVDDRTFKGEGLKLGDSVRIVYQVMPVLYEASQAVEVAGLPADILFYKETSGAVTNNIILLSKKLSDFIAPLKVGHTITVYESVPENANDITHTATVLNIAEDREQDQYKITVSNILVDSYSILKKFTYVYEPEYLTECEMPYDVLYIDFVMAQIAYYQNDLSDYNKFVVSYNQKLADLERYYKSMNPIISESQFKNIW